MAVSALSYQLARMPKVRRAERRQGSEPTSANIRFAPGPAAAAAGPNGGQGRSEAVRPGGTIFFFFFFFFFSLRPRVAQHFTLQIGNRKMTSVSSSNPARIRVLQAGLRDQRSRVSGHRVQVARECHLAAWPLTASAVVGQQ
jgi:hypothetical protein